MFAVYVLFPDISETIRAEVDYQINHRTLFRAQHGPLPRYMSDWLNVLHSIHNAAVAAKNRRPFTRFLFMNQRTYA